MTDAQYKEEGIYAALGLLCEPPMDGGSRNAHEEEKKKCKMFPVVIIRKCSTKCWQNVNGN